MLLVQEESKIARIDFGLYVLFFVNCFNALSCDLYR